MSLVIWFWILTAVSSGRRTLDILGKVLIAKCYYGLFSVVFVSRSRARETVDASTVYIVHIRGGVLIWFRILDIDRLLLLHSVFYTADRKTINDTTTSVPALPTYAFVLLGFGSNSHWIIVDSRHNVKLDVAIVSETRNRRTGAECSRNLSCLERLAYMKSVFDEKNPSTNLVRQIGQRVFIFIPVGRILRREIQTV